MVEVKYKENWKDFVTDKQVEKHNEICKKVERTHRITRSEGRFLVEFDKKVRVCNTCGRPFKGTPWMLANFQNPDGEVIGCALDADCFECEMKKILSEQL
jgi:hypothetical protein